MTSYLENESLGADEPRRESTYKPSGSGGEHRPLIMSSGAFVSGFRPPDYLIYGLLQRRYCYSLTGPTGGGKTALALLFALHVALGRPIGGREVERGRVLFFAGESQDDIRMRWLAMAEVSSFDVKAIDVISSLSAFQLRR